MHTCIGMPMIWGVRGEVIPSLLRLAVDVGRTGEVTIACVNDVVPHDRARNVIVTQVAKTTASHLMFVDADNTIPFGGFGKLVESMEKTEAIVVSGQYHRRGHPYTPVWSMTKDGDMYTADSRGVEEIHYSGLGCALINFKWCLEHLGPPGDWWEEGSNPWFLNQNQESEDTFFCRRVREAGGKIYGDGRVRCGHLAGVVIVDDSNADDLRRVSKEKIDEAD